MYMRCRRSNTSWKRRTEVHLPARAQEEHNWFEEQRGKSPCPQHFPWPLLHPPLAPIHAPCPAPLTNKVTFWWLRLSEEKSRAHSV